MTKREIRTRLACAAIIGNASRETVDEWFNWIMEASSDLEKSKDNIESIDEMTERFEREQKMEESLIDDIRCSTKLKSMSASKVLDILRSGSDIISKTDALLVTRLFTRSNVNGELIEAIKSGVVEGRLPEYRDMKIPRWSNTEKQMVTKIERRPVSKLEVSKRSLIKWISAGHECMVRNKTVRDLITKCS